MQIQPYEPAHRDAVVGLALRAWAPVFESIEQTMSSGVYREFFPDWRLCQRKAVEEVCNSNEMPVWVAVESAAIAGFVALKLDAESRLGEIHMIAVDPDHQRRGIGTALTEFALEQMQAAGMSVAMVETGNDAGHAPARRTYEGLGFELFPVARYFKKL